MSQWTSIIAAIYIDTFREMNKYDLKNYCYDILNSAPKITGSECNAQIFVNVLDGYNSYVGRDCKKCAYKDTIIHLEEGGFTCEADEDYLCQEGEYQTRVVITIIGNLRDRCIERTKKEYNKFFKYVENKFGDIRNSTLSIED